MGLRVSERVSPPSKLILILNVFRQILLEKEKKGQALVSNCLFFSFSFNPQGLSLGGVFDASDIVLYQIVSSNTISSEPSMVTLHVALSVSSGEHDSCEAGKIFLALKHNYIDATYNIKIKQVKKKEMKRKEHSCRVVFFTLTPQSKVLSSLRAIVSAFQTS